jgi:DNA-binding LacI/PurR family transcriptional regulator
MAKIDDVAKLARVSKGTVSNVFSKKRPISKEVSERVLAAAKELNYIPNHVARSLAIKKTMIVGLKMPVSKKMGLTGFDSQMINGVIRECTKYGYRVLLDTLPEHDDVTNFSSDPVDGVIMLNPREDDPRIEKYERMGIPLVLIGRPNPVDDRISFVDNNNEELARQVGAYLLDNGHKRILFLNAALDMTVATDRRNGFAKAFEEKGLPFRAEDVLHYSRKLFTEASDYGYRSALEKLAGGSEYTAIITDTDRVAMGVLRAVRELELDIPGDISIVALCNDATFARETTPQLTTVELSVDQLGAEATKILIEKMENSNIVRQTTIDAKLVVRESCRKLN